MSISRRKALTLAAPSLAFVALAACDSGSSSKRTTATARAKPTATPASAVAAAAPASTKLILTSDLIQGSKNVPKEDAALKSCVGSSRFARNSQMVFRIRVYDGRTNDPMDARALSKVTVRLANGTSIDAQFGPHPKDPPNETFWTASWVVPKDHPTGTLKYSIVATAADGRTGQFDPFPVAPSLPSIMEQVLTDTA